MSLSIVSGTICSTISLCRPPPPKKTVAKHRDADNASRLPINYLHHKSKFSTVYCLSEFFTSQITILSCLSDRRIGSMLCWLRFGNLKECHYTVAFSTKTPLRCTKCNPCSFRGVHVRTVGTFQIEKMTWAIDEAMNLTIDFPQ